MTQAPGPRHMLLAPLSYGGLVLVAAGIVFVVPALYVSGVWQNDPRDSLSIVAPWLTHTAFNSLGLLAGRLEALLGR